MRSHKCTVWFDVWTAEVIVVFFYNDDKEREVTLNRECYEEMIDNFLCLQLEDIATDD